MSSVSRGVILAAGYGTRFLPVTKTIPKEMLPIVDVPCIEYIVNEFVKSGITKILIVTSRRKKALEDYFDREVEMEEFLSPGAKKDLRKKLPSIEAEFSFVRQRRMSGTGDALMLAEDFASGEPFVVAYPDDIVVSERPLAAKMIDEFNDTGKIVLALERMDAVHAGRYGVVETLLNAKGKLVVDGIVEKPVHKKAAGDVMVSIGRYLFTPDIFEFLRGKSGNDKRETLLQTELINSFAMNKCVVGVEVDGIRYDLGQPDGYVKAITHAALNRSDMRDDFKAYLLSLCEGIA